MCIILVNGQTVAILCDDHRKSKTPNQKTLVVCALTGHLLY